MLPNTLKKSWFTSVVFQVYRPGLPDGKPSKQ